MAHPNIIYILADDMGYGDVQYLNPAGKIATPHLDRLGREGLSFTDAHSSSAVCTPSRYSILTGRYCWRTLLKAGVNSGTSSALISPERDTVAKLLKRAGYATACIGKWHLGWEWAVKDGREQDALRVNAFYGDEPAATWIDYEQPITHGPLQAGFDHFFGISGSLDMPPYVYVEDDMPVEAPTAWGSPLEFIQEGPRMASLRANNVLGHLTDRAVDYIQSRRDEETPFFLYFPLTAPHAPIAPAPEFIGKSAINPYADFCMEVDSRVGQILAALAASGQDENTLVIFTSDNGAAARYSECAMLEEHYGHYCSHIYRGYKGDVWDGGHRIPFLLRWPDGIQAGSVCDDAVGIFDFYATAAELTGQPIADGAGEDSLSFLDVLQGRAHDSSRRIALIHHSLGGLFAIRQGDWKLCGCRGSGGWSSPTDVEATDQDLPPLQLYHVAVDPREQDNVASAHPEQVAALTDSLRQCIIHGRSTTGQAQQNDPGVPVAHWSQIHWLPELPDAYVTDD